MGRGTWVATAAAAVTATKHYLVGATGCGSGGGGGGDDDPRPSLILPAQKVRARERREETEEEERGGDRLAVWWFGQSHPRFHEENAKLGCGKGTERHFEMRSVCTAKLIGLPR